MLSSPGVINLCFRPSRHIVIVLWSFFFFFSFYVTTPFNYPLSRWILIIQRESRESFIFKDLSGSLIFNFLKI